MTRGVVDVGVASRGTAVETVAQGGIGLGRLELAVHLRQPPGLREVVGTLLHVGAPDREDVGAPLGGERRQGVGPDRPGRQALAHLDLLEHGTRGSGPAGDPRRPLLGHPGQALRRPRRSRCRLLEEPPPASFLGEVANRRRPLPGHHLASLVGVDGLAPAEHGGTGELRVGHLVVHEPTAHAQVVAREDTGPPEPPLVAAEDHVASRQAADDGRAGTVPDVAADGERLRRHDAPPCACRRHLVVVVDRVGVLHALHPPSDVRHRDGLLELAPADGSPHVAVHVAGVEHDCVADLRHRSTPGLVLTDGRVSKDPTPGGAGSCQAVVPWTCPSCLPSSPCWPSSHAPFRLAGRFCMSRNGTGSGPSCSRTATRSSWGAATSGP